MLNRSVVRESDMLASKGWVRIHSMQDGAEQELLKGHHGPVHCVRSATFFFGSVRHRYRGEELGVRNDLTRSGDDDRGFPFRSRTARTPSCLLQGPKTGRFDCGK